ncbi:MAG: response regulator [Campylobacterota bacterium]|nr:response regulator [Campylobacterota bacterium]
MKVIILFLMTCCIFLFSSDQVDQSMGENSQLLMALQVDQLISENSRLFIALIVLVFATIGMGIIAYLYSRKLKKHYSTALKTQESVDSDQTNLIANMSEDIFDITKEAIAKRNYILENSKGQSLERVLSKVIHVENVLLNRTNDLIRFLRLKSEKVTITNELFNINNVLNEVAGLVAIDFKGSKVELIFDIDKEVPRYLIGDSLHLEQILTTLLSYSMSISDIGEIRLEVSIFYTFEDKTELQFQITDTSAGIDPRKMEEIFDLDYDEDSGEHTGLGLFVINEIVSLMSGSLTVQSALGRGNVFTMVLPMQLADAKNRRKYRLPEKILTTKKVFIVDTHYNSALAVKKMFAYFKHEVKVFSREQFIKNIPNLSEYDIVVIEKDLFSLQVSEYLKKIKANREFKVVALSSVLRPIVNDAVDKFVDANLMKPLNQERVFELIIDLYKLEDITHATPEEDGGDSKVVKTHREAIEETKNIQREQFSDFKGNRLLIVEDNFINQKVLTNILSKSGMDISIANNGEEAVVKITSCKKNFDIVLMDINMPVMDGYTATEQIRATGAFDDLPIVSFTALVLDSEVQKMYNAGINAFLAKPLNIGKLYTAFDMFLNDKKHIEVPEITPKRVTQDLKGLNIKEGIEHASGSEALYIEVLNEFLSAYGSSGDLFERLVSEGRYAQVRMLCLDMKGLTGMIGAEDMHLTSDKIYKLFIYNNQVLIEEHIEEYQRELNKLVQTIQFYIDSKG